MSRTFLPGATVIMCQTTVCLSLTVVPQTRAKVQGGMGNLFVRICQQTLIFQIFELGSFYSWAVIRSVLLTAAVAPRRQLNFFGFSVSWFLFLVTKKANVYVAILYGAFSVGNILRHFTTKE